MEGDRARQVQEARAQAQGSPSAARPAAGRHSCTGGPDPPATPSNVASLPHALPGPLPSLCEATEPMGKEGCA